MMKMIDWSFLADPSYKPPEGLLDLNLKVDFKRLLDQFDKKTLVRFAVSEARLVLPVFEAEYPEDDRPRKALEAAEHCLSSDSVRAAADAANAAADAADADANAAADAADAAWAARAADAARAASAAARAASAAAYAVVAVAAMATANWVESAAYWVRIIDSNISTEEQVKRLLKIKHI